MKRFYRFGPFRLYSDTRVLLRNEDVVPLAPKAVETLLVLVRSAGQVVEKEALIHAIWPDTFVEENNLAQHISVLRKTLANGEGGGPYIETIPKRGYRFWGELKEEVEGAGQEPESKQPDAIATAASVGVEDSISPLLGKDPNNGFQHTDELKTSLEEESKSVPIVQPASAGAAPSNRRVMALAAAGVALAIAGVGTWSFLENRRGIQSEASVLRLTSDTGLTTDPAISPDGKLLAYASDRAGKDNLDIWVQQIDGGAPLRLTSDASDESEPSFSPDGRWIVFRSERDGGGIYSLPALGGEAKLIAKGGRHARFSPDGASIAFVTGVGGQGGIATAELFVIPSTGGTRKKLVDAFVGASNPVWSPDGSWILFGVGAYRIEHWAIVPAALAAPITQPEILSAYRNQTSPAVVLRLDKLKKSGLGTLTPFQWLADNRVLFSARSGDASHIFEIGLSPPAITKQQWRLESSPVRLTFGTGFDHGASIASIGSASGARRMAFASLVRRENLWSVSLDAGRSRAGAKVQRLTEEGAFHVFPSVSADGTKVAYIAHAGYGDGVWTLDLETGNRSLLTSSETLKLKAQITPDGAQVVYGERIPPTNQGAVRVVSVSGGLPRGLCEKCEGFVWDWSPDRRRLLSYETIKSVVVADLYNLETGKSGRFLDATPRNLVDFHWSRDGRWLTFNAQQGGRYRRLYVAPFVGNQGPREDTWIPITDGSTWEDKLRWSPDGNWIYSVSGRDGSMCLWAYPLDPKTKRPAGAPLAVFHSHGARLSLRNANPVSQEISVARDKIVFNMGEITGNIWMTELAQDPK